MNSKNRLNKTSFLHIFWFAVIAFITYKAPLYVDDYQHMTSFADGTQITSIADIFPSVATYYMTWGGRAASMVFIQLFLMLPKVVFALANGLIYVLVVLAIDRFSFSDGSDETIDFVRIGLLYSFLWFFMPDFSEVITWTTGTITYLWTNLIILTFGFMYYRAYLKKKNGIILQTVGASDNSKNSAETVSDGKRNVAVSIILYAVLGFLSGLSNEAGACTMMFALLLFFIFMIRNKYAVKVEQIVGAIFCLIGTGMLMLAPGNFVRVSASSSAEAGSFIRIYAHRIGRETFYSLMFLLIPFAICVAMSLFAKKKFNIFWLFAFVSIYVLTFAAGFANRVFQLPLLLLAVSLTMSISEIVRRIADSKASSDSKILTDIKKGACAFVCLMMLMVVVEVTAGMLYSKGKDSFFDRQMIYYHIYDTEGLLPGNGLGE
ncbi:DUF6056 family protein [Butyrivibrio sp. VCB2006]|uniref:DUF6056 family protein n=1 Tax=Butyrivibrio sp. VCB2006 TaxID=1280679 RepID=UPI0004927E24|nr:DUF6056 family protein [Butyrivibrio sp. VCB2006]